LGNKNGGVEKVRKTTSKGAGDDVIGRLNWIESEMKAWDVEHDVVQMVENSISSAPSISKPDILPYLPQCLPFFLTFPRTNFSFQARMDVFICTTVVPPACLT
jgi:hypothetical protein